MWVVQIVVAFNFTKMNPWRCFDTGEKISVFECNISWELRNDDLIAEMHSNKSVFTSNYSVALNRM